MSAPLDEQVSYYNRRWQAFDFANQFGQTRAVFILEAILKTGFAKPRMCDLGAGAGWLTGILSNFGPTVGVELSDAAVRQATEKYPLAAFVCADVLHWQWTGEPFDIVVSQEVIEHVPDQRRYAEVVNSILRPGGYAILTTPNAKVIDALPPGERAPWLQQPIENTLTRRQLLDLFRDQQFEVVSVTSLIPGIGQTGMHRVVNSAKLRKLLDAIGLGTMWERSLLKLHFGMYQAVVLRKFSV